MKTTFNFLIIITMMLLSNIVYSQSVPSYVPTNGLVGWWGFNGNAQDGSGNGNHGTVNGATLTTDRFGNQNGAYSFDGSSAIITVPNSNSISIASTNQLSIQAWAMKTGNQSTMHVLGKRVNGCGSIEYQFGYCESGSCHLATVEGIGFGGMPGSYVLSGLVLNAVNWYHFVGTFNGLTWKLYVNGTYIDSVNNPSINPNIGDLIFGASGTCPKWQGFIDDIGIWNRALTPQEITNLYNSQLPTQTSLCLPTITTTSPTSVGGDSVVIGGDISNDGGSSIVLRGVCYSTSPNPNMGNQRTEDGSGIGSFNTLLRGLNPSTTYYARSYAKNSNGVVVYGNEVSFTTSVSLPGLRCPGIPTVTDIDGNIYNTVQIGTQCWTQSNLKVTKYRNGDNIPTGLNNNDWYNTTSGAYAVYNNDPVNDALYGKLYNWYAVTDSRGLCPTGWHVPSDGEWTTLTDFLGGESVAGGAMKSMATQPTPGGWYAPNTGATNSSGFTGLPGGYRVSGGGFNVLGIIGYWWSSSAAGSGLAWYRSLYSNGADAGRGPSYLRNGFSVRCLKE